VRLDGEERGEGPPIVLLHGLTSTRRYVVMGSSGLERSGRRAIAYDARGHGQSSPAASPADYTYELLAADLLAVLDQLELERAVIAGASMGAHTAIRFVLAHPERVASLGLITPAYDPDTYDQPAKLAGWDALAEGLRHEGVEGFVSASLARHGREGCSAANLATGPSAGTCRRAAGGPAITAVRWLGAADRFESADARRR
jgi:pimeloyl-ACP methyl ester carboxylesterase